MVQPVINDTKRKVASESITMAEPITLPKPKGKPKTMAIDETKFGELKGKVDAIGEAVDRIEEKLFGNGQPGIMDILSRHDEKLNESLKDRTEIKDNLRKLSDIVATFTNSALSLSENVKDIKKMIDKSTPNWLLKHWKALVISGVLVFVFLHSILPPNITVWDLLGKILGLK